jgi:hypothetical protein
MNENIKYGEVTLDANGFNDGRYKYAPIRPDMVEILRLWVNEQFIPAKSFIRHGYKTSYGLKHLAERDLGCYVGNGEMIEAFMLEGYKPFREGLNARFKIKYRKPLVEIKHSKTKI